MGVKEMVFVEGWKIGWLEGWNSTLEEGAIESNEFGIRAITSKKSKETKWEGELSFNPGWKEGWIEGWTEGWRRGWDGTLQNIVIRLLNDKVSKPDIAELLNIRLDHVNSIVMDLKLVFVANRDY